MNPVSSRILCAALLLAAFTPTIAQEPFPGFPMFPANHKRMPGEQVKLTAKSAWRFLNPLDGTDPAAGIKDFHSTWTKLTFDDSKWGKTTCGFAGYGKLTATSQYEGSADFDVGTPESGKRYTAYFRHLFAVEKAGVYDVDYVFSRDDAAIIYINGKEVARSFEPGAVEFASAPDTYELLIPGRKDSWTDGTDEMAPHQHIMRNVALNAGNNILAMSIHNCLNPRAPISSDLGFMVRYLSIAPAGTADKMVEVSPPRESPVPPVPKPPADMPAPEIPLAAGPASSSAFDELFRGTAVWSMDPAKLEEHFAGHRFLWQDAAKSRAQIIPENGSEPVILDQKLPVVEAGLWLTNGKLSRLQYLIYTRGDAGELSKASFTSLIEKCRSALTSATGVAGKERAVTETPKAAVKTSGITWTTASSLYLLETSARRERNGESFTPEFIRLVVVPAKAKLPLGTPTAPAAAPVKREALTANILKTESGDVYIQNIPMVDQGQKGYCAVASAERVLRYYGISSDQHELAQIADASSGSGTNPEAMFEALKKLRGRFHIQLKEVIPWSYDDFIKLIEKYNDWVEKTQEGEYVDYPEEGDIVAVIETMQGTTLKAVRGKKAQLAEFRKKIGTAVDAGIPLLWGVHLGIFEEPGVPQEGGGHMRLIIGYNDKTGHVLYSDSWGAGHELKRMPLAEAAAITFQLHMIRPSQ